MLPTGAATRSVKKAHKKKEEKAAAASFPDGLPKTPVAVEPYPGGTRITEHRNALGQTVYSVGAAHFDISRPVLELAAEAGGSPSTAGVEQPAEREETPIGRLFSSDFKDPVVQSVIPPPDLPGQPAAPATGFNFTGLLYSGSSPPDPNGSVGNGQFVETGNVQYRIWTLNYATKTATPLTAPANINTIWAGFGGACQAQNSGDPIVLYDKIANRWLISQITFTAAAGLFYECVAVSTTANAAGTYARYAFVVPVNSIGDYPKYAVWPDAYYGIVNVLPAGDILYTLYVAMDRTKMLAGDPTATWQVIPNPNPNGFASLPADLDGFALPPTNAPGVFLYMDSSAMSIFRMHVDFTTPANTTSTLQAALPVAPWIMPCNGTGLDCVPQPGATNGLVSVGGPLMFRAAYRNFLDHESIVVSRAVDPGIIGVPAAIRWFDIRLSGTPDATCATYPCRYQQGTLADVANGRCRWVPSLAMDTAENMLMGYSTSGKTAGTDNHSIRYTGRAKGDPLGVMTAPETIIFTGTANFAGARWGDYTSMSVDPIDDCTFWYVNEFYTSTTNWSTRIASVSFPAGSGPGQCPPTTCTARPASAPAIGTASTTADNQITVSWTGIAPPAGAYAIERAEGTCGSEGLYRPIGTAAGGATSFNDTGLQGGYTFSYRVKAASDAAGKCQSELVSACVSATATGNCTVKPVFPGAASASGSTQNKCGSTINWGAGTSSCPLTPSIRFNVYRGTTPDFVPSAANRIASCLTGVSSYSDTNNLASGVTYYYIVHAEDGSSVNGGACGGNEETNSTVASATAYGPGLQGSSGTWTDAGGDGTGSLSINFAGPGDTSDKAWRFVRTADDAAANHTPGGAFAYRNAGPAISNSYAANACAELQTPALTAGSASVNLQYWERHQLEYRKDAIAVEYSVNGGPWNDVPAPSNDAGLGCDPADAVADWDVLECGDDPTTNACGYPNTKNAFTGAFGGGGDRCSNYTTLGFATSYTHRCHPITDLTPGDTVQFRWRFSSNSANQFSGFYLDDIAVTNILLPNVCAPDTCAGQANGTGCNDGDPCTSDACLAGSCTGTPGPTEAKNLRVQPDKATYLWDAVPLSSAYDVVRGALSALPVGPGGADEVCFDDLGSPSVVDAATPSPGTGYWYLSRGEGACGIGTFGTQHNGTPRTTTTCP